MALITRTAKGSPLTTAEMDGNLNFLDKKMGWVDYNDAATAVTPIPLTLADTFYPMTNDGLGPFTNKTYKIPTHGEIWNAGTGLFDFSSLKLGDTVDYRLDLTFITSGANRDLAASIELGIGTAGPYSLTIGSKSYKSAGSYQEVVFSGIYMGDANTLSGGGRFVVKSDGTGDEVTVNGFYIRTAVW
tara:strand:+ start:9335 stop:9895 length:561 start_codon:yes stop_codon:yes gene_type:complete